MKIVSLLPSATEIVFALGLGDELRGVTFECDHPASARALPHVTGTALGLAPGLEPAEIDAAVSAAVAAGADIYTLDAARIRAIDPDVILTQDLCRVCAVPTGTVTEALEVIGCSARVVSLDPHGLDEVIAGIGLVGEATGTEDAAASVMADLRGRVAAVEARVAGRERPRVLVLEWAEPPFNAGHWVPEMVEAAGGTPVLAVAGEPSRRLTWQEIGDARFDVVVFSPCGFTLPDAIGQVGPLLGRSELACATRVVAVDANACFSRPGPRLVDGVEALAEVLHPTGAPARPAPDAVTAVVRGPG